MMMRTNSRNRERQSAVPRESSKQKIHDAALRRGPPEPRPDGELRTKCTLLRLVRQSVVNNTIILYIDFFSKSDAFLKPDTVPVLWFTQDQHYSVIIMDGEYYPLLTNTREKRRLSQFVVSTDCKIPQRSIDFINDTICKLAKW